MTKGVAETVVAEHSPADSRQVLQLTASTLGTLSALLGLTAFTETRARSVTAPAPAPAPAPASAPLPAPAAAAIPAAFTLEQVGEHCWPHDCWIVLYDRVYDVTGFLPRHPGGADILLENAGRDATSAFSGVGHSAAATEALRQYQVGVLADHQCMWSGGGAQ